MGVSNAPKPFILEVLLPRVTDQVPHVDESGIASLEGKLPNYTIHYHSYKIIKEYFEPKYNVTKCQLFLSLLKYISLTIVRIILGIKRVKIFEKIHHIVRNLMDAFQKVVNKYRSKYRNASRHVFQHKFLEIS